ncbi:MAG: tetraacyldisaccharide 4'-kinase [Bacteroidetes bacterium]|nr:tetraacyldisaccharide 4'-kinase [Bacteroidota bacterium]
MRPHRALLPLSWVYGLAVRTRNLFYDIGLLASTDVGVPVISVGNITAGGTGKTPVVAETVRILRDAGMRPAVISRGYGRTTRGTVVVCDGKKILADAAEAGDEPLLLAGLTGHAIVICDEQRVRGARTAIDRFRADVIVLDDGFQHRAMYRTTDIVLVDVHQPPYTTPLLPAGYLREPVSALERASAMVATKAPDAAAADAVLQHPSLSIVSERFSAGFVPTGLRNLSGGARQSLEILKGHSAVAVCGIAVPESFRRTLTECGVTVQELIEFPDHHRFTGSDIDRILASYRSSSADLLLTTEKDAVRLQPFLSRFSTVPASAVMMEVRFHQQDAWSAFIRKSAGR